MKLLAALCALYPLVATAKGDVFVGNPQRDNPPGGGPPDHVLEKFRHKFGVKKGFELRKCCR